MRPSLHEKTLDLVKQYVKGGGKLPDLAAPAGVTYHRLWQWVRRDIVGNGSDRLNVDAVQKLYEHLTGKQLEY